MLSFFYPEGEVVRQSEGVLPLAALPQDCLWIDLLNPGRDEEIAIEGLLGIEVPTREEMQEIEASSRLYKQGDALVMTLPVLARTASAHPETAAVTFMLVGHRLITVRYASPSSFSTYIERIARQPGLAASGEEILLGLLEQIADRLADISENTAADLERISHQIFHIGQAARKTADFKKIMTHIGHAADITTRAKDSLLGLNRLILFFAAQTDLKSRGAERIETLLHDIASIDEHARFLSEKVGFLLNASMGMLNIEQNNIIKLFSVAAVAFMPPTLIASIYGMNFHHMPELEWPWGYPCAIAAMVASAVLPLWYFKKKNWL